MAGRLVVTRGALAALVAATFACEPALNEKHIWLAGSHGFDGGAAALIDGPPAGGPRNPLTVYATEALPDVEPVEHADHVDVADEVADDVDVAEAATDDDADETSHKGKKGKRTKKGTKTAKSDKTEKSD